MAPGNASMIFLHFHSCKSCWHGIVFVYVGKAALKTLNMDNGWQWWSSCQVPASGRLWWSDDAYHPLLTPWSCRDSHEVLEEIGSSAFSQNIDISLILRWQPMASNMPWFIFHTDGIWWDGKVWHGKKGSSKKGDKEPWQNCTINLPEKNMYDTTKRIWVHWKHHASWRYKFSEACEGIPIPAVTNQQHSGCPTVTMYWDKVNDKVSRVHLGSNMMIGFHQLTSRFHVWSVVGRVPLLRTWIHDAFNSYLQVLCSWKLRAIMYYVECTPWDAFIHKWNNQFTNTESK